LTVHPLPLVSLLSGTICSGDTFTLIPSGAVNYTFMNGGPVITIFSSASFTVIGSDNAGCVNTGSAAVSVNPLPNVTASSNSSVICSGNEVFIYAAGANTYTWSNSINANYIAVQPTITQVYMVIGEDTNGCKNSATFMQLVDLCTNISNINHTETFDLFPNPTRDHFILKINSLKNEDVGLSIFDVNGKLVLQSHLELKLGENNFIQNISKLAGGVYLIVLNTEKTTIRKKLVVAL
jgi:hypothetical protein